jgi:hypothetical protein
VSLFSTHDFAPRSLLVELLVAAGSLCVTFHVSAQVLVLIELSICVRFVETEITYMHSVGLAWAPLARWPDLAIRRFLYNIVLRRSNSSLAGLLADYDLVSDFLSKNIC